MKKKKIHKSAVDGKFVSKDEALKNPDKTFKQTVKSRVKAAKRRLSFCIGSTVIKEITNVKVIEALLKNPRWNFLNDSYTLTSENEKKILEKNLSLISAGTGIYADGFKK